MIRKSLAFIVLVVAGMFVLSFAIGGEVFTGVGAAEHAKPRITERGNSGGGVQFSAPGEGGSEVFSIKVGGKMSIPRSRTVKVGAGTRELRVYLIECEDSEPISDDLLRMVNLTVDFYEVGGTADNPEAVHTARLVAEEAEVQLGVDENGRTSVEEDKEMRVRRAVLKTTARARVRNLTLQLDEALALVTEGGIRLYTPDALHPFQLTVGGDQPLEITGNGLQAWLPGRESLPGDAVRIEVSSNPELIQTTSSGVTHLQARGKLSYREDRDGGAVILMEDEVRITMEGESFGPGRTGSEGGDPLSATGRRLRAQLARHDTDSAVGGGSRAQWQRIWLEGDPAILTGNGAELRCSSLEITPGPDGQPYLFSATGSPAVMDYRDGDGVETHFEASRRIHLLRPGNHQAPVFTAFGFPRWSMGLLNRSELVIFEGKARMDRGDEFHLTASDGLWLLRSLPAEDWVSKFLQSAGPAPGTPSTLHGIGDVEVVQRRGDEELRLHSNMGFTLVSAGNIQHIRLGPDSPDPEHIYSLTRGELTLHGVGRCQITQGPEWVTVELRAPGPQINAEFGAEGVSIRDVSSLDATISHGILESFMASGPVCRINGGSAEQFEATAQKIVSLDPNSLHLSGTVTAPARAHFRPDPAANDPMALRARDVRLVGPDIWIHRLAGDHLVIEASAPEPSLARLQLEAVQGTDPSTRVDLHARRIRLLPYAVAPLALHFQTLGLPTGARELFALNLRTRYLIAEDQVRITQEQEAYTQQASGDFLLLGLGSRGGYLTGNPARLERRDSGDQRVTGIANRINLRSRSDGELLELVASDGRRPELEMIDPSGSLQTTSGEPSRLRVVCDGDIRVFPEAVRFLGSVELHSLNMDGSDDPEGLRIAADRATLARHPETGEILGVDATGHVRLDWSKVTAWGHTLTLDPQDSLVTVSDPARGAVIELPNGLRHIAAEMRANYGTLELMSWSGRVDGGRRRR